MAGERPSEALPVTELTPEKLTAKYEREFAVHLEAAGIPEDHPDAPEELRMRNDMETHLNLAIELSQLPGNGEKIRNHFVAMQRLYEKRMQLRSKLLKETLQRDLGLEGTQKPGASLSKEAVAAFGGSDRDPGRKAAGEKIKSITDRIDAGEKSYVQVSSISAKEVAKAQIELEKMKNSPLAHTPEQQEAIARTETALARIADINPTAVKYHRWKLENKKAPFSSLGGRYARFATLLGTSILTAWALIEKNLKMAGVYGAAAALIWKPDFLSSADKKLTKKMEYLAKPQTMDLLSRTQGGPKWSEAVAALFAIEDGSNKEQKAAIALLRKEKAITIAQAAEITGGKKNAFYRKLEAAGSDEERAAILRTFSGRGGGERGRATIEYLKSQE